MINALVFALLLIVGLVLALGVLAWALFEAARRKAIRNAQARERRTDVGWRGKTTIH